MKLFLKINFTTYEGATIQSYLSTNILLINSLEFYSNREREILVYLDKSFPLKRV